MSQSGTIYFRRRSFERHAGKMPALPGAAQATLYGNLDIVSKMENFIVQAVFDELKEKLLGQRLGKVFQLSATDCAFDIHLADGSWLFVSCQPSDPHIYLTSRSIKSLEGQGNVSPQFALVLRKHLGGATLVALTKPSTERVIEFEFSNYDSAGETRKLFLIVDLTGRSSNLYLLNAE